MPFCAWLIFLAAAIVEVGGNAVMRTGLRGGGLALVAVGFAMLGCYGMTVNLVQWDFSWLLGVYVAVFAAVSVLWGRFVFGESVPPTTWMGLAIIVAGALVIQFGAKLD